MSNKVIQIKSIEQNHISGATDAFVKKAFNHYNLKVLGNGLVVDGNGHAVPIPKDQVMRFYDLIPYNERKGVLIQAMDPCIRETIRRVRNEKEALLIRHLGAYKPDPADNLGTFCRLFFSPEEQASQEFEKNLFITRLIIENFIRQVKQKMNKIPVLEHIMPILVGPQGVGKSTLVQQLLAPLKDFYSNISLKELVDTTRNYPVFGNNYVLVCEELAGAKWSEYESIKSTLTSPDIEARVLGTQNRVIVPNKSTIIGTSNRPSSEVIKDPTGSRRLFDIWIRNKIPFEKLGSIDYSALWLSVPYVLDDTQQKDFFAKIDEFVRPLQAENKFKDLLEEFVETYHLVSGDNYVSTQWLHKEMIEYADFTKQNNKLIPAYVFSQQLKNKFKLPEARKHNIRGFKINYQLYKNARYAWNHANAHNEEKSMPTTIPEKEEKRGMPHEMEMLPF